MNTNDTQFFSHFGSLVQEVSRLTKIEILLDDKETSNIFEVWFKQILDLHYQQSYQLRTEAFAKMLLFEKHLKVIEAEEPKLLKRFQKRLKLNRLDEYIGVRFEVDIAAKLLQKDVRFACPDPPDFKIQSKGEQIAIECAAVHISKKKIGDLKYKIGSMINKKAQKPYCTPTTALFLDFTNIHHAMATNHLVDSQFFTDLDSFTVDEINKTRFGSLLLFSYRISLDRNRYESAYVRVDNKEINSVLKDFLNEYFPFGETSLENYRVLNYG